MPTNEKPAYVYMLLCGDGSLYTGITTDMRKRMRDHVNKTAACAKYTRHRTVTALAAAWQTTDMTAARRLEWALHHTDRPTKDALVAAPDTVTSVFPKLTEHTYIALTASLEDYTG